MSFWSPSSTNIDRKAIKMIIQEKVTRCALKEDARKDKKGDSRPSGKEKV
jgi:hypothetical protein